MKVLIANIRKDPPRKIRKEGKVPAILYGHGIKNEMIEVEKRALENILKHLQEDSHISLSLNKESFEVVIREIQRDPVSNEILHVDFFKPAKKEVVEVTVPIIFDGESPAIKEQGGELVKNLSKIELKGPWEFLPSEIRVDLSKLKNIGDKIFVGDLHLPENVKTLRNKDEIVAFVKRPEQKHEI